MPPEHHHTSLMDKSVTSLAPTSELILPRLAEFANLQDLDLSGLPFPPPLASTEPASPSSSPASAKKKGERVPKKRSCEWCQLLSSNDAVARQWGELPGVQSVSMPPGCCDTCVCAAVEMFPQLRHLQLTGGEVTDAGLAALTSVPLSEIHMRGAGCITDTGMAHLGEHGAALSTVVIHGASRITDQGLCALASCYGKQPGSGLRVLSLSSCTRIRGEGVACFSALQSLNLSWCRYLTDGALQDMQDLHQLRVLRLAGCLNITDDGMEYLRGLSLYHLDLQECERLSDRTLQATVSRMVHLNTLNLQGLHRLTDEGIASIASCQALEKLDLKGCVSISDDGLTALFPHIQTLTWLDISSCRRITHKGLLAVARHLPNLRHLSMAQCTGVGNTGLAVLGAAQVPLSYLNVSACSRVTGTGVAALKPLAPTLQELHISWCDLNDPAAIQLCCLRNLTHLHLEGCCRVSVHVLETIRSTIPGLMVLDTNACSKAAQKLGFHNVAVEVAMTEEEEESASATEGVHAEEEELVADGADLQVVAGEEEAEHHGNAVLEEKAKGDSYGVEVITSMPEEPLNHEGEVAATDACPPEVHELVQTPSKKSWFKKMVSKKSSLKGNLADIMSSPKRSFSTAK